MAPSNTANAKALQPGAALSDQQLRTLTDAINAHGESLRREIATVSLRLEKLTEAVLAIASQQGARLSRAEVCERQGVHRNTLLRRLQTDRKFPRPGPDGKWSAADVLRWELANLVEG